MLFVHMTTGDTKKKVEVWSGRRYTKEYM